MALLRRAPEAPAVAPTPAQAGLGSMAEKIALVVLALFVFSIPAENGVTLPGGSSISRLLGIAAFGTAMLSIVRRGVVHLRKPSLFLIAAFLFFIWTALTYFWSWVPSATFGAFITYAQLFMLAWLIWQFCRGPRESAVLMQAFVLGCYVLAGAGFATFLSSPDVQFRDVGEFNANEFAITAALGIPMAWNLGLNGRHRNRFLMWLNLLYPLVAIAAVVLAASRGGMLTTLVAVSVIPLTLTRLSLWRRLVIFALIGTAVWAVFVYAPQVFPDLQQNIERLAGTDEELASGTLTGRTEIWAAGLSVLRESPVVGIGMRVFRYAVEPILGTVKAPHNAFLEAAVGGGLIGFVLFSSLSVLALISAFALRGGGRTFMVALVLALLVGMQPSNSTDRKYTWFVLTLVAAQAPIVVTLRSREADAGPIALQGKAAR